MAEGAAAADPVGGATTVKEVLPRLKKMSTPRTSSSRVLNRMADIPADDRRTDPEVEGLEDRPRTERRGGLMAATLDKTKTPGIYKRGSRYVFSYRVNGGSAGSPAGRSTRRGARRRRGTTDVDRGEFAERSRVTLHEYLVEWIERYQGTGRRASGRRPATSTAACSTSTRSSTSRRGSKLTDVTPYSIAGSSVAVRPGRQGRCCRQAPSATRQGRSRPPGDREARGPDPPQPGVGGCATAPATDRGGRGRPAAVPRQRYGGRRDDGARRRSCTSTTG